MFIKPEVDKTPSAGLRRNDLSGFELTFQSIGTVAPSAVIALIIPVIYAASGNAAWMAIAFAGMGICSLALQMGAFARRMASPGALYAFVHAGLGPVWGMIAGGSILFAYIIFTASIAPQISNVVSGFVQVHFGNGLGMASQACLMIFAMMVPWLLARRGAKLSTRITSIVELATMLMVLGVISAYFFGTGSIVDSSQFSQSDVSIPKIRAGLVISFMLYGGFETALDLAAEAKKPFVLLPKILMWVSFLLIAFFVLSAYGIVAAFQGVTPKLDNQEAPLTFLSHSLGMDTLGTLITLGILCSMMASALGAINAAGRIFYAFAHRGIFSPRLKETHAIYDTPHNGIGIVTIAALLISLTLTFIGIKPLDQLNYLGTLGSLGILVPYLLIAISTPVFLRKRGEMRWEHLLNALVTIFFIGVTLVGSLYPVPDYPVSMMPYIYLVVMASGIGYFLILRRIDPQRVKGVETELLQAP